MRREGASMEAWCTRLIEVGGGKHRRFSRAMMEEDKNNSARLAALSNTISLSMDTTYAFLLPKEQEQAISLCNRLRKLGWKLSIKNHQLSWWFDGEPLKAVLKDSATFGMGLWDH